MNNRTINQILISVIIALCVAICVLIGLIASRPQQVITQNTTSNVIAEMPASEILSVGTANTEESSVTAESTSANVTKEATTIYAKTTSLLNIRASNSVDAAVLETVSEGTILEVLEIGYDGWTKILYEEQEAYVSSSYIILIQD